MGVGSRWSCEEGVGRVGSVLPEGSGEGGEASGTQGSISVRGSAGEEECFTMPGSLQHVVRSRAQETTQMKGGEGLGERVEAGGI